ncbi:PolC-type DNA polymerase III [Loktanella sp. DJP18]|uniref:3'-5' exonuclease n=1 Tax=Loktanella sp. DJP18 TaxID=3409788 RepID=UPI003BB7A46F
MIFLAVFIIAVIAFALLKFLESVEASRKAKDSEDRYNHNRPEYLRLQKKFDDVRGKGPEEQDKIHLELRRIRKKEYTSRSRKQKTLAAIHASMGEFIVADCETTGLNTESHRIIEISAIRFNIDGGQIHSFSRLIKYRGKLPQKIVELTGISDSEIKATGQDPNGVYKEFYEFVGEAPVFFHNASFDRKMIESNVARVLGSSAVRKLDTHCTLEMSREMLSNLPNHRLATVANFVGSSHKPSHRGIADALATKDVVMYLRRQALGI